MFVWVFFFFFFFFRENDLPSFLSSGVASFVTPKDEFGKVYISFWLMGAAFLIPWTSMLSVSDYWSLRIEPNAIFKFTISYMMTNLVGLVFIVFFGDRVPIAIRIVPGLLTFLVVLVALLFTTDVIVANVLVALLGLSDAIVQGSIYGLAGQFHPRFINAVMSGNGIAGIIISVIQLTIMIAVPAAEDGNVLARGELTTRLFFSACGVVIVLAGLCFVFLLQRSPVTKHYLNESQKERLEFITGKGFFNF